MIVFLISLVVLLIGATAALLFGKAGAVGAMSMAMPEATSTAGGMPLPDGPITSDDVAAVRFDRVLRGYRMDQVDQALDRLRAEIAERDARLAALNGVWDDRHHEAYRPGPGLDPGFGSDPGWNPGSDPEWRPGSGPGWRPEPGDLEP